MQRTAICLVVLALLAGCSGGIGGESDGTPTQEVSPAIQTGTEEPTPGVTPTPASTPPPTQNTSGTVDDVAEPATTRLDAASANRTQVLEGDRVRFNATVTNLNDRVANQTVTVQVGATTVLNTSVELDARETRTIDLLTLDTSYIDPGEKFVTVSTETDSTLFRMDIRPRDELAAFIDDVRERTVTLENGTALGRDHVRLTFDAEEDLTALYRNTESEPVPQAAAFEMATSEYAPSNVTVRILPDTDGLDIPYRTELNESVAEQFYNQEIDPREFRHILHQRATGANTEVYAPYWTDNLSHGWAYERFTYLSGDRARLAHVKELSERLNSTQYGFLTVEEYGLYNGTAPLPDTTRNLGPNESIYISIEAKNLDRSVPYRGFNSTRFGIAAHETIYKYGNMTEHQTYGEHPEFVQLRVVWPDGTAHTTMDIPTKRATEAASTETVPEAYISLILSSYTK